MNPTDRNGAGASPRRRFDETYKRHAVELTLHGDRTVKTVAKELGDPRLAAVRVAQDLCATTWRGGPEPKTLEEAGKEIGRLRAEVIRMREREVVLKKSLGILSETPESGMPRLRR